MNQLHLEKLQHKDTLFTLKISNMFSIDNIFSCGFLNTSQLNTFNITNISFKEYIIKTNTNSLDDYDIAVTNLGSVWYNTDKFEHFILCLDNTNRFMITAKEDNIPLLWEDGFYPVGTPKMDYILYVDTFNITDFNTSTILNIQFLLYMDYKYHSYQLTNKGKYVYNYIEFLCMHFFNDIKSPGMKPIRSLICSIYKKIFDVTFSVRNIENFDAQLLLEKRKSSKKFVSDIKLFTVFRSNINSLIGSHSKGFLISRYFHNTQIDNDLQIYLKYDHYKYVVQMAKQFCDLMFHTNYIISKYCNIHYEIISPDNIDIYSLIHKWNPTISLDYIKELFNIKSLVRYANNSLEIEYTIGELYDMVTSSESYIYYINKKHMINQSLVIKDPLIKLHIKYYLDFKDIYHRITQKIIKEDAHLRRMLYLNSRIPSKEWFTLKRNEHIMRSNIILLIDILYQLSSDFIKEHKKHIKNYKEYPELRYIPDFASLIEKYRLMIESIMSREVISECIDIPYLQSRLDNNYTNSMDDNITPYRDFNLNLNILGTINKKPYILGCLSTSRKFINVLLNSDGVTYSVGHTDNSFEFYNAYFFYKMTRQILNEFKNSD